MANGPILVVDDDSFTLQALTVALTLRGYRVLSADSAATALSARDTEDLKLVLVDLPLDDALSLARDLRAAGLHVPLIYMSADPAAEQHARALGAAAYLRKPVDLERLLAAVEPHARCA